MLLVCCCCTVSQPHESYYVESRAGNLCSVMQIKLYSLVIVLISEHGGHHGHSHSISRSNNKLTQLANTDDNENNSFMYQNNVSAARMMLLIETICIWMCVVLFYCRCQSRLRPRRPAVMVIATIHHRWTCAVPFCTYSAMHSEVLLSS